MRVERVYWKFGFLQASLEGPREKEDWALILRTGDSLFLSLTPRENPELFLKNKMVGGYLFQDRVKGYFSLWDQCITLHNKM